MKATNLDLIGENRWGQTTSRRIYSDESGMMHVGVRARGSIRKTMVPYHKFADENMPYWYIIERSES